MHQGAVPRSTIRVLFVIVRKVEAFETLGAVVSAVYV